ncbi:MAG: Sir2 family NAD-dependent protein deacetylase, partial [Ilumatobacteraceae bacterium]
MTNAHHADQTASIERARAIVAAAGAVAVLTGAGISTAAGIPDFRGPDGVWTRDPEAEKMATIRYFMEDAEIRRTAWQRRLRLLGASPQPTVGHRALVDFEQLGSLIGLATQNVDGLHHLAGSDPSLVHEVHGTLRVAHCTT